MDVPTEVSCGCSVAGSEPVWRSPTLLWTTSMRSYCVGTASRASSKGSLHVRCLLWWRRSTPADLMSLPGKAHAATGTTISGPFFHSRAAPKNSKGPESDGTKGLGTDDGETSHCQGASVGGRWRAVLHRLFRVASSTRGRSSPPPVHLGGNRPRATWAAQTLQLVEDSVGRGGEATRWERGDTPASAKSYFLRPLRPFTENVSLRSVREMQTIAVILDHLVLGRSRAAADVAAQSEGSRAGINDRTPGTKPNIWNWFHKRARPSPTRRKNTLRQRRPNSTHEFADFSKEKVSFSVAVGRHTTRKGREWCGTKANSRGRRGKTT